MCISKGGAPLSQELALRAADILEDRKAQDVVILDVGAMTVVADHFVIATARNRPHLEALGDAVNEHLKAEIHHREGRATSNWILIDLRDVIIHLFLPEARAYYALERLWGDAPRVAARGSGGSGA